MANSRLHKLPPFFEDTTFANVVIDTPKASSFKMKFDEKFGIFRVHKAMPLGVAFPFNFGFVPSTRGGDNDPLDAVLLTEHIFPAGAVVLGRLIAVLEAVQREGRRKERNDRLIAIPVELVSKRPMLPSVTFNAALKKGISEFFVKYNELQGKTFHPIRYASASEAIRLVRKAPGN